jgi:Single-strand binding protein family
MIDAIVSGKLIKDPTTRTGPSGKPYTNFLLSVSIGDGEPIVVSGICFAEVAGRVAVLKKGDPLCVVGSLKPSEWQDKTTNETKHGLNVLANGALSPYDIVKRRKPVEVETAKPQQQREFDRDFDDVVNF